MEWALERESLDPHVLARAVHSVLDGQHMSPT